MNEKISVATAYCGAMRSTEPARPVTRLDEDLNWLLHRVAYGVGSLIQGELLELGLGVRAHTVLSALAETPGRTQNALASRLGLDKSTLTGVLDELERRQLVRRRPAPEDRRARVPELTAAGAEMLERTAAVAGAAQERVLAVLSSDQREALRDVLGRLLASPLIGEAEPGGSCM